MISFTKNFFLLKKKEIGVSYHSHNFIVHNSLFLILWENVYDMQVSKSHWTSNIHVHEEKRQAEGCFFFLVMTVNHFNDHATVYKAT